MHSKAFCAVAQSSGEFRILPIGKFRPQDNRPLSVPWNLTRERGQQLAALAMQRSMDYVIDYEHQTLHKEKNGQPAPAAGWFKSLDMRADGLYVVDARWTAAAKRMIQDGEYRFVSPVFRFDRNTGDVLSLESLALTNDPALHGLTDLKNLAVNSAQASQQSAEYISERSRETFAANFGMSWEDAQALSQQSEQAAATTQAAGMSEKDRATFMHVFGEPPEALAARFNVQTPPPPEGMNAEDWAKFRHVFGDALNGE
jgi:phage I-like protein